MNPSSVRLFLTFLWLVPGVALLVHDVWTGWVTGIPFGGRTLPLWVVCLILAAFNFVRWWAARPRIADGPSRLVHHRRPRDESGQEPNPAFRFDEPPAEPGGRES